ncbi:MAG: SDR family oxidoreductase [Methanomicrobiaceae archaeon]|nr:SDR family oxidoreductase [Methanomicrobiaceae archaeon]
MKYVVTGGAGFIGSNLAAELAVGQGHEVVILDDLSTGRMENIDGCADRQNVTFVRGSVLDEELLQEICAGADGVFHQAAIASVPRSVDDPMAAHAANLTGTLHVLIAARDAGVRRVVAASTAALYGNNPVMPKRETMAPETLSPYAAGKLACEHYGQAFSACYGLSTAFLRYFNVFGPRQDPGSGYAAVIPAFISRLLAGDPPLIFGNGTQTRDFVFIRDVVRANILAMAGTAEGAFNIACGKQTSLIELAAMLSAITGVDIPPVYAGPRAGDVQYSVADIGKARAAFGYEPAWTMRDGLEETVEWFSATCRSGASFP